MKNEIILFKNQNIKLEVNLKDETVWLNSNQMAKLFDRDIKTIRKHINNALKEECDSSTVAKFASVQKEGKREVLRNIDFYNLDVIISVGYRVKSKNGIIFRKWANKVLKDYLLKGYVVNQKRLEYLEKTVKLIDIASRIDDEIEKEETKEIIKVINSYSNALKLLDNYDHKTLSKPKGTKFNNKIKYNECINIINKLKFNNKSKIFALERNKGLESIIENIYQTFNKKDVYPSIEEKALTSNMEKLGKNFYEDYYYPSQKKSQKDVKKYMEKFSSNGISINLDNLTKISSLDKDLMKNQKSLQ